MSNFRKLYDEKIVPELMKEHNYTTIMAVPKLEIWVLEKVVKMKNLLLQLLKI